MKTLLQSLCFFCLMPISAFAAPLSFTVNMSEAVTVSGCPANCPRIAVDVGGVTRYASYASGTGGSALTFTYTPQVGDVDLDGVTVSSPVDLNGGTIVDLNGNAISDLTFTPPNTANVKINYPSLGMDFVYDADGRYTLNGTAYNDLSSFLTAAGGTFSRGSVGTYFDSTGTLQTASANTPRFDHDPVTHAAKGILIEEQRTNLLAYSEQFDNASWVKSNSTIVANATTAPDGTMTADKLVENTNNSTHYMWIAPTMTSGVAYTFSVFLKKAERDIAIIDSDTDGTPGWVYVDLSNGTFGAQSGTLLSKSIIAVGSDWYKVSISYTADRVAMQPCVFLANNIPSYSYIGDGTSGIYVWGAQLEQGAFPTSYIPTTNAAVARHGDIFQIPYSANFLSTKGAWYAEAFNAPDTSFKRIIGTNIADGYLTYGTNGAALQSWDGVSNMQVTISPSASDSIYGKYALGWDNSTMTRSLVANAGAIGSGGYADGYQQSTAVWIGGAGGYALNSHVRKAKYYPVRVSDTQLQLLTQ
ncbi:MAG TPA: hypothetical protein PKI93_04840 [Alphaproteobacteria bacterium]|nr:hypothetical protein [Alphaproteobacteria bacterium]